MATSMIAIRAANEGDKNFIYATWLRGLYHGSLFWACTTAKEFYKYMGQNVTEVLSRPGVEVRVVSVADEPSLILGYAVFEGPTLHWVYVKAEGRSQGLARKLLEGHSIERVSNLTTVGDAIRRKRKWRFYPW